jgi:hypothetical protein
VITSPDREKIEIGGRTTVRRSRGCVFAFEISRYRLDGGRRRSLYLFMRWAINIPQKFRHVTVLSYIHSTQPPAVKVNFVCGGYYWGSPVWIRSTADNIV